MKFNFTKRQKIATVLLIIIIINILTPIATYALTSGPAQPETKGFQPAGVSDMVDLSTGDFKYNIPLLDIDGYPINLNYQSGTGIDDEASWVGLGWSLTPGAINRQVRGIPDDFNGDQLETDHFTKPKITIGGRITGKVEIKGKGVDKLLHLNGSLSLGIFSDNYTGIGADLSANAGLSIGKPNDGLWTGGLGAGITSNTATGVDVSPYVNISYKSKLDDDQTIRSGLSAQLGYNTRSGVKALTLGPTFNYTRQDQDNGHIKNDFGYSSESSIISFNTEPISPKIQVPYFTNYGSFSFDAGPSAIVFFASAGITGYRSITEIPADAQQQFHPGYGFLYAQNGKSQGNAVMDFIREKENPVIPQLPNLALPVHTPDLFTFTSQSGSGQFRLYRGGTGAFFDSEATDGSTTNTVGFDAGLGLYAHFGTTLFHQHSQTKTNKWNSDNPYLSSGNDFQDVSTTKPSAQNVYFKMVGEKGAEDYDHDVIQLHETDPLKVKIVGKSTTNMFLGKQSIYAVTPIKNSKIQPRRASISYLTATEASAVGLDKQINIYNPTTKDASGNLVPAPTAEPALDMSQTKNRVDPNNPQSYAQPHHISEMMVTDDGGKRMVYGIPVYNTQQDEYSFAVGNIGGYNSISRNLVDVPGDPAHNNLGIDHYYHKDSTPPYASSYLLTAILSPDYVDKTGDGITDDDLGTAIKFNYSRLPYLYKWRTPYQKAALNKCLLADPDDDKGSVVYGKKEIYYVQTIESKTKIAYFITKDREDALGSDNDWTKGIPDPDNKQKYLSEIRLYSKADMNKPIKVVKFDYRYTLCPGIPNSSNGGGKLTLNKVWFEYGNSDKGKYHPYQFSYKTETAANNNIQYNYMMTDRWGIYKEPGENPSAALDNDAFPYSNQNKSVADENVALWHLNKIDLPTGGEINISYESDDYAYVQDRKAMVMTPVGVPNDPNPTNHHPAVTLINYGRTDVADYNTAIYDMGGVKVDLAQMGYPAYSSTADGDATAWFKRMCLSGSDYLYNKYSVDIHTSNSADAGDAYHNDFVSCYAKVQSVIISIDPVTQHQTASVLFEPQTNANVTTNPIMMTTWQKMKNEYPRYAYPGFDKRAKDNNIADSFVSAISALWSAAKNLSELVKNFYEKARDNRYGAKMDPSYKSFVRLTKANGKKLGGGIRVKQVAITDNWNAMNSGAPAHTYGQAYNYTIIQDGQTISSGVASNEPTIGSDESPLKQPVWYVQTIKGGIGNLFDLEEPFGESFFPAPSVVYSKVTITDLVPDANGNPVADPDKQTGYVVNEFYTAKDFPVKVNVLDLLPQTNTSLNYSFDGGITYDELTMSQGYSIELNDMPGKPKATRVFDRTGAQLSSTEYSYNTSTDPTTGVTRLSNSVAVVGSDGKVSTNKIIGRDIDFFTDMREQTSVNEGQSVNAGGDLFPLGFLAIPLLLSHAPFDTNSEYKTFRSACAVKVVQYYGILDKVVKTENGSKITTQNVAYDSITGEPLITRTQNEFDKDIYTINLPAYWMYKGMGGAYQNQGIMISGVQTNSSGGIFAASNIDLSALHAGDELVDLTKNSQNVIKGTHYWIIQTPATVQYINGIPIPVPGIKKIINRDGTIAPTLSTSLVKVIRSGYRNQISTNAGSIVCLNNPIGVDGSGNLNVQMISSGELTNTLKVINASASTFDESWAVNRECVTAETPIYDVRNEQSYYAFQSALMGDEWGTIMQQYTNGTTYRYQTHFWGGVNCSTGVPRPPYVWNPNPPNYGTYGCGPIYRSSIQLTPPPNETYDYGYHIGFGFQTCINTDPTKTYYLGFWSEGSSRIYVDNNLVANLDETGSAGTPGTNAVDLWHIVPIDLSSGASHTLYVENVMDEGSGWLGVEIYQNTFDELTNANATGSNINTVFTTASLVGKTDVQSFYIDMYGNYNYHYLNQQGTPSAMCPSFPQFIPTVVNPYVQGYLGNWRPYQTLVYQKSRNYGNILNPAQQKVDVPNAGFINNFFAYWYYNGTGWVPNPNASAWTVANTVTQYDKYGQQLENKDALGRYSAAKFDFNGELPSAVASNAMNREIYASSFEDNGFIPGTVAESNNCNTHDFVVPGGTTTIQQLTNQPNAHSGNYCKQLNTNGVTLTTTATSQAQKTINYLSFDSFYQYTTQNILGLYPNGFQPSPNKDYIFDAWVNDNQPTSLSTSQLNFQLKINGAVVSNLKCKAIVEGWKLVEGRFTTPSAATQFTVNISAVSAATNVYIDDIRMFPAESHMKTYAYDAKTMRLMAELDENCFATFYEYDSEGLLVRVKKETERGIVTLKESRSSYRKQL